MTTLPENIDLTSTRDFGGRFENVNIPRHVVSGRASIGSIDIEFTHYDDRLHKGVTRSIRILPWNRWKSDFSSKQDLTSKQTYIEQETGVRFDGPIENPFILNDDEESIENKQARLLHYRVEELGHKCYRCGKDLKLWEHDLFCLCTSCREEYNQEEIYRDLQIAKPDFDGLGHETFFPW